MARTAPGQLYDLQPPQAIAPELRRQMVMHHLADLAAVSQAANQPPLPFHRFNGEGGLELVGQGYVLRPPSSDLAGLAVTRTVLRPAAGRMHFSSYFHCIAGHLANIKLHAFQVHGDTLLTDPEPLDPANFNPEAIGRLAWRSANMVAKTNRYRPWAQGEIPPQGRSTPSGRSDDGWKYDARQRLSRRKLARRLAVPGVDLPEYTVP